MCCTTFTAHLCPIIFRDVSPSMSSFGSSSCVVGKATESLSDETVSSTNKIRIVLSWEKKPKKLN